MQYLVIYIRKKRHQLVNEYRGIDDSLAAQEVMGASKQISYSLYHAVLDNEMFQSLKHFLHKKHCANFEGS